MGSTHHRRHTLPVIKETSLLVTLYQANNRKILTLMMKESRIHTTVLLWKKQKLPHYVQTVAS